eukprot:TRINITY_DN5717_c0_g1_i13.p2 TRINITY_DN5717_c0_g1~~TRINITY_DN5717_c0_g1_i13.p2  ORF type:complete len:122 (+),score=0.27 TRINITY_DN5717_c0_g1_i13:105-470(+)
MQKGDYFTLHFPFIAAASFNNFSALSVISLLKTKSSEVNVKFDFKAVAIYSAPLSPILFQSFKAVAIYSAPLSPILLLCKLSEVNVEFDFKAVAIYSAPLSPILLLCKLSEVNVEQYIQLL